MLGDPRGFAAYDGFYCRTNLTASHLPCTGFMCCRKCLLTTSVLPYNVAANLHSKSFILMLPNLGNVPQSSHISPVVFRDVVKMVIFEQLGTLSTHVNISRIWSPWRRTLPAVQTAEDHQRIGALAWGIIFFETGKPWCDSWWGFLFLTVLALHEGFQHTCRTSSPVFEVGGDETLPVTPIVEEHQRGFPTFTASVSMLRSISPTMRVEFTDGNVSFRQRKRFCLSVK